jgi:NAD(P)-dependent dehydrogenase (short-subunit alcohol dehydrogenase family)
VSVTAQGPIDARLEAYRTMFRLDGKTALVLGAASGIGKASAEALAALGAAVICADKNKDGVESTAAAIGDRVEAHVTDAGSAESINALAAMIEKRHMQLDVAVTTPAVHVRKLMCDYTDEEYDRVADLNLRGTFLFLRAFGRIMARQRRGSLIASSSVRDHPDGAGACFRAWPFRGAVNAIVPSIVDTPLVAPLKARPQIWNALAAHTVFNRWADPSEVAAAVAFLACDAARYVTGTALLVDGGWTAIDGPPTGLTKTHQEGATSA